MRDLTNTKLFDILRDKVFCKKKADALTSQGWTDWYNDYRKNSPMGFWITETFPRYLERIVHHQEGHWDSLRSYISNRFTSKTHMVVASSLKKGDWYETDERLLHMSFQLLVDFIEHDKAQNQYWSHKEKYKRNWFCRNSRWVRAFQKVRDAQAGIDYIRWEMALTYDSSFNNKDLNPNDDNYSPQARHSHEIMTLYHWWKEVRPNRIDSYVESGLKDFEAEMAVKYEEKDDLQTILSMHKNYSAADKAQRRVHSEQMHTIDNDREKEDEAMLVRLAKIRRSLWS